MWPPTNASNLQGMMYWLTQEPGAHTGTWGEVIIPNFMGSDYTVVLIATQFPNGDGTGNHSYIQNSDQFWGAGSGQWTVNYQQVSTTFWPLALYYSPVAVLTFSRWDQTNEWHFEVVVRNDYQADWANAGDLSFAGTPFAGGDTYDPAHQAGRPNSNGGTVTGYPPDRNYPAWNGTDTSNNVRPLSVMSGLVIEMVTHTIGAAGLGIFVTEGSTAGLSSDSNNFVSAFAAYHSVWYQSFASSSCQVGFHTHVGYNLSIAQCEAALCIQLQAAIQMLGGEVTEPCPELPPQS